MGQEASHWSHNQGSDKLGVLTDSSDGIVHHLVQDELLNLSVNRIAFLRSLVVLFRA